MRSIKTLAAAMAVGGLLLLAPASAQETCVPSVGRDNALGTSRTVEVDTSKGPLYGFQYKDQNFLGDGEVVLTFDDGPLRSYTVPVLEALAAHCTKATFFVVGRMAVADPEMVKEYDRRGHTIGTHTWSHVNLRAASPARARAEIEL
ncbi:MAG TPA: polysaccharide deacetylase family protein, partial [Hyphomicrobiaceae bacterium]